MKSYKSDQGFSIIEVLIASAVFVGMLFVVSGSMLQMTKAQKQIESRSSHLVGFAIFNKRIKTFGAEKRSDFFDKNQTIEDLSWVSSSSMNITKYNYPEPTKPYLVINSGSLSNVEKTIYLSSSVIGKRLPDEGSNRLEKAQTEIAAARCLTPGQVSVLDDASVTTFAHFIRNIKVFPISITPPLEKRAVLKCCKINGNSLDCNDASENLMPYTFFALFNKNNDFKSGLLIPTIGEESIEGLGFLLRVVTAVGGGKSLLLKTFSMSKCDKRFRNCSGGKQFYLAKEKEWNSEFNATIQGSSLFPIN